MQEWPDRISIRVRPEARLCHDPRLALKLVRCRRSPSWSTPQNHRVNTLSSLTDAGSSLTDAGPSSPATKRNPQIGFDLKAQGQLTEKILLFRHGLELAERSVLDLTDPFLGNGKNLAHLRE